MSKEYRVAVVGATGAVGRAMRSILAERDFPVKQLVALATAKSAGMKLDYRGEEVICQELTPDSFKGIDLALFSAGGGTSLKFAPIARDAGCVVVDNSSAWRMEPDVPLVVPEVNPDDVDWHKGIIANPNCSTIQMVVVMKPLHDDGPDHPGGGLHLSGGVGHRRQGHQRAGAADRQAPGRRRAGDQRSIRTRSPSTACRTSTCSSRTATPRRSARWWTRPRRSWATTASPSRATCVRVPGAERPLRGGEPRVRRAAERRAGPRAAGPAPGVQVMRRRRPTRSTPCRSSPPGKDDTYVGRIRRDPTVGERAQHVGGGRQPAQGSRAQRGADRGVAGQRDLVRVPR